MNACLIENRKALVLKRLERAKGKLRATSKEINEAGLAALEMKETGNDLADQRIVAMAAKVAIKNAEITMRQA